MTALLDGLGAVPPWLLLALVFVLPALEASVFLGVVVPGETIVLVGGVAARAGHVPLAAVIVAAVLGALLGDQVGFAIGRRYGRRLIDRWAAHPHWRRNADRALALVRRRGVWAVALGRWVAGLRTFVPGVAGMSGLPRSSFTVANALGGCVWAVAVASAGYLAGASYRQLESRLGTAGDVLVGLIVLAVVGWWLSLRFAQRRRLRGRSSTAARSANSDAASVRRRDAHRTGRSVRLRAHISGHARASRHLAPRGRQMSWRQ